MKRGKTIQDAQRDLVRRLRDKPDDINRSDFLLQWREHWIRELGQDADDDLFLSEDILIGGGSFSEHPSELKRQGEPTNQNAVKAVFPAVTVFLIAFCLVLLHFHGPPSLFMATLCGAIALLVMRFFEFRKMNWRRRMLLRTSGTLVTAGLASFAINVFSGDAEEIVYMGVSVNTHQPPWLTAVLCISGLIGAVLSVTIVGTD